MTSHLTTAHPARPSASRRRLLLPLAAMAAAAIILPACGGFGEQGSGTPETASFDFTDDVSAVTVGSAFQAEVRLTDGPATVEVTVDDNLIDNLEIEVRDDRLHVGFGRGWIDTDVTPTAIISVPALTAVDADGAASITVMDVLTGPTVTLDADGASTITAALDADSARIDASGASNVDVEGRSGRTLIDASGASRVHLDDLDVGQADIDASGASRVELGAATEIDVDASGASRIVAPEGAIDTIELSGASKIERP